MRILLVCDAYPPERIGGIGYIVSSLRTELLKNQYDVTVLSSGACLESDRLQQIYKSHKRLFSASLINNFIIAKWIIQKKFDIINLHQTTANLFLLILPLLKLFNIKIPKIVNSLQVDYVQEFRKVENVIINEKKYYPVFAEKVEKYLKYPIHICIDLIGYYFSDQITVVSKQNELEIKKNYGFMKLKPTMLIPNGIDVERFRYTQNAFDGNILELIYIGSFRARKRIFHMLELVRLLKYEHGRGIKLHIIGAGRKGYREKINGFIKDHNLSENIILHGQLKNDQIPMHLSRAHIFLLLSSYEGLSVALLEALGSGKLIISSNLYGSSDIIENNKNGILVELDKAAECANIVNELYDNPNRVKEISDNAFDLVQKYSWKKISLEYMHLYQKLLEADKHLKN